VLDSSKSSLVTAKPVPIHLFFTVTTYLKLNNSSPSQPAKETIWFDLFLKVKLVSSHWPINSLPTNDDGCHHNNYGLHQLICSIL